MVGRGTRRHPGKQDCLAIDLVGVSEQHDLVTVGALFDIELPDGASIMGEFERAEVLRDRGEEGVLLAGVGGARGRALRRSALPVGVW